MSFDFSKICVTSLLFLCIPVESLRLVNEHGSKKNTSDMFFSSHIDFYEDHPMYPSDLGLEYLPGSDGLEVRVNPNVSDLLLKEHSSGGGYVNRMLVVPKHKLAFCYIEKVGCTQFNLLMNRLNGFKSGGVWFRSSLDKFDLKLEHISRNNGWFRGVFLREPMHRFLSAFNSKCLPHHDHDQKKCIIQPIEEDVSEEQQKIHFDQATQFLEEKYKMGNPHFDPMANFCGGLSNVLSDYDYVGHLDKGYADVHRQVAEMLGKRGIKFETDFEAIFPTERPSHKNHLTETEGEFLSFFDESAVSHVQQFYTRDYSLLNTLNAVRKS